MIKRVNLINGKKVWGFVKNGNVYPCSSFKNAILGIASPSFTCFPTYGNKCGLADGFNNSLEGFALTLPDGYPEMPPINPSK